MVAGAAHDRRQRVVAHDLAPGSLVVAFLGEGQPGLDILAGRAGMVARRQTVQIDGPFGTPGPGLVQQAAARIQGDRERFGLFNGVGFHSGHLSVALRLHGSQQVELADVPVRDRL